MASVSMNNILAISFDLDDTLYDNVPVIKNAFYELYQFLITSYENVEQHYSFDRFLESASLVRGANPKVSDLEKLRHIHVSQVLNSSGYSSKIEPDFIQNAFSVFWKARQRVSLYPEVHSVLGSLSKKIPLITISNGNACTQQIGINQYFQFSINSSDTGKGKPDKSLFLLACKKLSIHPQQLLHIGDNIEHDIEGANKAGCRSVLIDREYDPISFTNLDSKVNQNGAEMTINTLSGLLKINFI